MPAFLKQPWGNTRSTLNVTWQNNLENFEKLSSMIQSCSSIYIHFLKPLHWNIHELWHQALAVMKITVKDFEKIVKSPHFLHLTSINWLVLKTRLRFGTWCRVLYVKGQNSRDKTLCKSDVQQGVYPKLLLIKLNPAVFLLIA